MNSKISELIKEIQNVDPTHRFGQIICNSTGITCPELYYLTDGQLTLKIKDYHNMYMKVTNSGDYK